MRGKRRWCGGDRSASSKPDRKPLLLTRMAEKTDYYKFPTSSRKSLIIPDRVTFVGLEMSDARASGGQNCPPSPEKHGFQSTVRVS